MDQRHGQGMESVVSSQETKGKFSREKKLSLVLAIALTLSACAEKAKTWSTEQLAKFSETPNIEKLGKGGVDQIIKTIHDFDAYVEHGGSKSINFKDKDEQARFDADPSLVDSKGKRFPYVHEATLLAKDTVLVEDFDPLYDKAHEHSASITMHDTVYRLLKDEKTGRFMVVIKQGNLLESEPNEPLREVGIDQETGVVTYVAESENTGGEDEGFVLEPDKDNNLQVQKGRFYEANTGQTVGEVGVGDMTELSKRIPTQEKR